MKKIFLLMLTAVLLSGCGAQRKAVPQMAPDTTHIRQDTDSVLMHDSIYIHEYTRGDTIYIDRWRDRWQSRTQVLRDTVYIERPTPVPSLKSERQEAKGDQVLIRAGPLRFYKWCTGILLTLILLLCGFAVLRVYQRLHRV